MTEWLVRHFVPRANETDDPCVRERYGLVASVFCIVCNVVLAVAKGIAGWAAGSVAIVADAANNLSDASSNVVSLLGFKLASKPPDEHHPYGHGRFEYLASLGVAMIVSFIGIDLVRDAVGRILVPQPTETGVFALATLVGSIVIKLVMMRVNAEMGRRISSDVLAATAVDSRNDVIATSAVLASALVSRVTGVNLDGWMGMAVGLFILWSGMSLVRSTVDTLLGEAPDPALVAHVEQCILEAPGVLGMHDLMIHDYGPGRQFASAHVEMAPDGSVVEDHEVLDAIERKLWEQERLTITLHLDPFERG